jgi:hypothetical protein
MNGPTTSFTEIRLHRQVRPYSIFLIAWPVVDRNLSKRTRHINIITIKEYSVSLGVILKFIKHPILPKICGMSCTFKIRSECTFCRLHRSAIGVKWAAGRRPSKWDAHRQLGVSHTDLYSRNGSRI